MKGVDVNPKVSWIVVFINICNASELHVNTPPTGTILLESKFQILEYTDTEVVRAVA